MNDKNPTPGNGPGLPSEIASRFCDAFLPAGLNAFDAANMAESYAAFIAEMAKKGAGIFAHSVDAHMMTAETNRTFSPLDPESAELAFQNECDLMADALDQHEALWRDLGATADFTALRTEWGLRPAKGVADGE